LEVVSRKVGLTSILTYDIVMHPAPDLMSSMLPGFTGQIIASCSFLVLYAAILIGHIVGLAHSLARDVQAKLALIVAQCLSIHLSICVSVCDSLSHAYVRSIARREPRQLPGCLSFCESVPHGFLTLKQNGLEKPKCM